MTQLKTLTEKAHKVNRKAVFKELNIGHKSRKVKLFGLVLPGSPLQQVSFAVHQAAHVILLDLLLPLLRKYRSESVVDDGRLLKVLEGANGALKDNKPQLEHIK